MKDEKSPYTKPMVKPAKGVATRHVRWLVDGIIPRDRLTIIDGDPGQGKSMITLELAAAHTTGQTLTAKGRRKAGEAGTVLIMNAEDDIPATMVPRLIALGADLARVFFLGSVRHCVVEGKEKPVYFPEDADVVEKVVKDVGATLVIVDPVMAFLGPKVRTASDQAVRAALGTLKLIAEKCKTTVVMVRHLNKAVGSKVLYRGGGSIGIIGLTRAAIYVGPNPEDKEQKLFAPVKNNLESLRTPWAFRMVAGEDGQRRIYWEGEKDIPLSRVLDTRSEDLPIEKAIKFLRVTLQDGKPRLVREIMALAMKFGIKTGTLVNAKKEMGIFAKKVGSSWEWSLGAPPPDDFERIKGAGS